MLIINIDSHIYIYWYQVDSLKAWPIEQSIGGVSLILTKVCTNVNLYRAVLCHTDNTIPHHPFPTKILVDFVSQFHPSIWNFPKKKHFISISFDDFSKTILTFPVGRQKFIACNILPLLYRDTNDTLRKMKK